ncbi:uncharacterized protein K02A2.6 [Trichonephila clavipes]|nr:uncharacterized protein K02A2.6 [Trichonephila clavipes]
MEKSIEIVRAAEASREQIQNMKYDTATINFVKENQNKPKTQYNCKKCLRKHKPRECPAFRKICAKCKKNHFTTKCFQSTKNINEMNVPENELVYIDSVNENETKCAMKNSTDSNFKNVEMVSETTCISKNELIKQYKDVFTGVGEFPNEPYHITLKDNAVPVIHPPRPVLLALQPKLKSTLDRLKKGGIVSKVNKPTDWVQSLVIVEKPNENLRLCLDPRDFNKVIKREHYKIPCSDDIISRLEGKKIFSVVDLKDGFWRVPLDEVTSEICTFNTPFGRYKFNKMPFGIVSAPEVFQKRNQKLFGDIEGVKIYFDDIICCRM